MAAAALIRTIGIGTPVGDLVRGISWKFEIRQTHALVGNLVGANVRGRLKSEGSAIRDVIVFIHSVAADTEPADQRAVAIQARAARKENDSALVRIWRAGLKSLRARIGDVHRIETEERPGARTVNSRGIKRLRAKADGAVCHCRAQGH